MYCRACSASNFDTAMRCERCGEDLLAHYKLDTPETAPSAPPAGSPNRPRLTAKNYLIALFYVALVSAMQGASGGLQGVLRVAGVIVAVVVTMGMITSMDSRSPDSPRNRPIFRTVLAAIIMGVVAFAAGGPWLVCLLVAAVGAGYGAAGWPWVKYVSI